MNIHFGKMVEGKTKWIPSGFFFGGCLFLNWLRGSALLPLPNLLQEFLEFLGVDTIGD